ncbi:aspartic peptidase domain-containing protein [Lanmaoa asiatica]|nr:aspartic peptidase domain-containing protein [Lanmaoa asiatica]
MVTEALTAQQSVNQIIGISSTYSSTNAVQKFPADGLMGMCFPSLAKYTVKPFFQSTVGQMDQPVFSFKLAASESELYFGNADSAPYSGDLNYTPVTEVARVGFAQLA